MEQFVFSFLFHLYHADRHSESVLGEAQIQRERERQANTKERYFKAKITMKESLAYDRLLYVHANLPTVSMYFLLPDDYFKIVYVRSSATEKSEF
jgi:hypothetical protein